MDYTIQKGDNLSTIAVKNKTTVADLLKANPNIKDPNLIYAGANLVIPNVPASTGNVGGTSGVNSGVSPVKNWTLYKKDGSTLNYSGDQASVDRLIATGQVSLSPTSSNYSGVNNAGDANKIINANQNNDITDGTQSDEPPVKGSVNDLNAMLSSMVAGGEKATSTTSIEDIIKAITPKTEKPTNPNYENTYNTLKGDKGVAVLEATANSLKAQKADIEAIKAARTKAQMDKPITTGVIAGKVSDVERQENERLDAINRDLDTTNDELTTAYNSIDTIMKLKQLDYGVASDDYNAEYTKNINMFNLLKGVSDDQKTAEEKKLDNARSNLQIVYNSISSGAVDLNNLDSNTTTLIKKLEVQAGLPSGFFSTLQNKNPKAEIVSTTNWTSADNKEYVSVITKDATGALKTTNVLLGNAKATTTTEADKIASQENIKADIDAVKGGDGKWNPDDLKAIRDNIAVNDPSNLTWFDNAYPPSKMLNPNNDSNIRYLSENKWDITAL